MIEFRVAGVNAHRINVFDRADDDAVVVSVAQQVAQCSVTRDKSGTLRLPFGHTRTSPVAAFDVAAVAAKILLRPAALRLARSWSLPDRVRPAVGKMGSKGLVMSA